MLPTVRKSILPTRPSVKSGIMIKICVELWWLDADRGNPKTPKNTLSVCHL